MAENNGSRHTEERHNKWIRFDRFSDKLAVVSLGSILSFGLFIGRNVWDAAAKYEELRRSQEQYCDARVETAITKFDRYIEKLEARHDKEISELKGGLDKANSRIIRILERTSK